MERRSTGKKEEGDGRKQHEQSRLLAVMVFPPRSRYPQCAPLEGEDGCNALGGLRQGAEGQGGRAPGPEADLPARARGTRGAME